MDDTRWLQHAVASAEGGLALLPFVDEFDPSLQNVEHLEVAEMLMQAGGVEILVAGTVLLDPDHVGADLAVGRVCDPKIAVLHEVAEASFIHRVLGVARGKFLLLVTHDLLRLFRAVSCFFHRLRHGQRPE